MSLTLRRENTNGTSARYVTRDPFALARELFAWDPSARPVSAFSPSFDVKETAEAFVVRADLPGVDESHIDVSVHNGVLSITGSRQAEERKEGESYSLYERQFGSFTRSFVLPDTADAERIEAKLVAGVLELSIAKRAQAKPRKISVSKS